MDGMKLRDRFHVWSHSRTNGLTQWLQCPRLWCHSFLWKDPAQPVSAFVGGIAVHEAIRRYGKHCWEHEVREDHKAIAPIAAHIADPARQTQFLQWAEEHLWDWEGLYGTTADPFEVYLQATLPEGLGTFQGHLDYLRRLQSLSDPTRYMAKGMDWKGGHNKGKCPPNMPPQQQWQAFLIAKNLDVDVIEMELEFIGSGWVWPGPEIGDVEDGWILTQHEALAVEADIVLIVKDILAAIDLYERVYDDEAIESTGQIEAARRKAADTAFPCVPGEHCYGGSNTEMWCPYSGVCPAFQLADICVSAPAEVLNAGELSSRTLRACECWHRAQAKMIDKELKRRVLDTGPIKGPDGKLLSQEPQDPLLEVTNVRAMVDACERAKESPDALFNGSQPALRRAQENPTLRRHIREKPRGPKWAWRKHAQEVKPGEQAEAEPEADAEEA